MEMHLVSSSNIHSIGYDSETLHVRFSNGSYYTYNGVPESLYMGLMLAASKGSYFAAHIKPFYHGNKVC